ncbi:MAG TPA: hypothetical protein VN253_02840, partial [Kofleriaceae bacterium]|nr:hypothetical protein [Kofleriaceae bacterium]
MGLLAATAAGIASVSASGVVTIHPATMSLSVTLSPAETVTTLSAQIYPVTGGQAIQRSVAVQPPAPYTIDVTVDGGDPLDPTDDGFSYRPTVYAYLQNPTASTTYLQISRNTSVPVDNTPDIPSAWVPVTFHYPTTRRANTTITVIGGTINTYDLYASGSNSTANESYFARTYGSGSSQTSAMSWVPMVAASSTYVSGTVYVMDSHGVTSQRSLATQTVDLSSGDVDVSWVVDLTHTGVLEGDIAISTPGSTAIPSTYQVYYYGASASTSGIYGSISVDPSHPQYEAELTAGEYNVFLRTYFSHPYQYSDTGWSHVVVDPGDRKRRDFNDAFGVGRLSLDVQGFYSLSSLQSATSYLTAVDTGSTGYHYQWPVTSFDHTVPVGSWRSYYTQLQTYDQSNPNLPNYNTIYRYHYNDPELPATNVTTSGITNLGTESVTLVKSNVYFDVAELEGQPEINISSPQIYAYKLDYNANSSLRRQSVVYSYGSGTPRPLSGLTMVAEPGVYTLDARAYVNGTLTRFNGTTITFGEPRSTPASDPSDPNYPRVETVLTPVQNPSLKVTLGFDQVVDAGISTVVETPLGPAPPEGFAIACGPGQTCDPIYYDISTTAHWTGQTKVCVRRQFTGVSDETGALFQLMHYNELLQNWEQLEAPNGSVSSFNCNDDPAACGCADRASCGIDRSAVPAKNVFLVCGMANSFSPFAIFQKDLSNIRFTNKVGGVEYTGPTGPSGLQEWEVPADGTYRITAIGAQGGSATGSPARKGGCGTEVS